MTTSTTIRGLFATALLLGAAAPAFAQGGTTTAPATPPANRPAATAPNSAATGNSAAPRPTAVPAERQGSAVMPGAGGTAAPSGTVQGSGGPARTN